MGSWLGSFSGKCFLQSEVGHLGEKVVADAGHTWLKGRSFKIKNSLWRSETGSWCWVMLVSLWLQCKHDIRIPLGSNYVSFMFKVCVSWFQFVSGKQAFFQKCLQKTEGWEWYEISAIEYSEDESGCKVSACPWCWKFSSVAIQILSFIVMVVDA